ncbi:MAG: DUF1073 domain-containing protein [Candidatus Sabulitectum sp.]|nr:DUF1073 domain-containing protein [Candidatus Sabulitectum sp.]
MSRKRNRTSRQRKQAVKRRRDNLAQTQYGFVNPLSGAGTSLDKNSASFFQPTLLFSKNFHETIYVESWAARKFVDIPVDDMFVKWRQFSDMDNRNIELVERAEVAFDIPGKLSQSLKSSTLYGTGLFVILTKEATPDKPLIVSRLRPGDLANIITVDRFDATVAGVNNNPYSRNYSKPEFYKINLKRGAAFTVHHSRVIRFDGIKPTSDNSWQVYDQSWGVASLIPVITEIFQDSNVSKGVSHLVNEASIPVQKIEGFEDALAGNGDEMSIADRMAETTALRSIYRTVFMDSEDDFSRHDITFAGLPDILDRNAVRLAAAANIPHTRFWGKSAVGLAATGEGDARDYALQIQSSQENKLPVPLSLIDSVLERHLGLPENINYEFVSIIDASETEKTDIFLKKSQAVVPLVNAGIIDEDESRAILDGDQIAGNLDDLSVGQIKPDDQKKALAAAQSALSLGGASGQA